MERPGNEFRNSGSQRGGMNVEEPQSGPRSEVVLRAGDVARKLRSFDHFIYLYGQKAGYYLPPKHALTWSFVAQILAGEKMLLKASDVGPILSLPKSRGILIQDLWQMYREVKGLHRFFPDMSKESRIPRDYFFNVVSSGAEGRQS